eukprot:TRINITY_DN893_c2_g6_i1.p1 TRINITY_DN893_c2_g6~~TRINITY_DN893_c2_g6_i1.p1  ORF type:complete len:563 (+),score=107.11 TRINITY_DN893_c2_g6_i1:70-1689(+)
MAGGGTNSSHSDSHDFDLRQHPLAILITATIVLLIAILYDVAKSRLEKVLHKRKPAFLELFKVLETELSLLGLVGFSLFILSQTGGLEKVSGWLASFLERSTAHEVFETFEWVHIFLFVFVVFYITFAIYLVVVALLATKTWESRSADDVGAISESIRYYSTHAGYNPIMLYRLWRKRDHMLFSKLKARAIARVGAPKRFPWALYLKYAMQETIVELCESEPVVILVTLSVAWILYGLEHIGGSDIIPIGSLGEALHPLVQSLIVSFLQVIVYFKVRKVAKDTANNEEAAGKSVLKSLVTDWEDYHALVLLRDAVESRKRTRVKKRLSSKFLHTFCKQSTAMRKRKSHTSQLFWWANPNLVKKFYKIVFFAEAETFIAAVYSASKAHKSWYWYVFYAGFLLLSIVVVMPFCLSAYVTAAYTGSLTSDRLILKAWMRLLHREETKPYKYPPPPGKKNVALHNDTELMVMAFESDDSEDLDDYSEEDGQREDKNFLDYIQKNSAPASGNTTTTRTLKPRQGGTVEILEDGEEDLEYVRLSE